MRIGSPTVNGSTCTGINQHAISANTEKIKTNILLINRLFRVLVEERLKIQLNINLNAQCHSGLSGIVSAIFSYKSVNVGLLCLIRVCL